MSDRDPTAGYWLEGPDGSRHRIGPAGLLIGRGKTCNIQIDDKRVSQYHALIRPSPSGLVLFSLGRNPTRLNRFPSKQVYTLSAGDLIRLPGVDFKLVQLGREPAVWSSWSIKPPQGSALLCPDLSSFTIGGGRDEVYIPGWPPSAVLAEAIQDGLVVTCMTAAQLDGEPLEPEALVEINNGATLSINGSSSIQFFLSKDASNATTLAVRETRIPSRIQCKFLPRGGVLTLHFDAAQSRIELSELRFSLVLLLLNPGRGYAAGDFIPDNILIPGIWPNQPQKVHTDLNLLLHRVRKNLVEVGINPFQLIERPKNGYATRFRLSGSTNVSIE